MGRLKVIVAIEPDISTETVLVMVGANVQADRDQNPWTADHCRSIHHC